jgi:hypothetical protein
MKLLQQNHQINFFTNNEDVVVSHPIISLLMERLAKFNLIPTYGQEMNASTGEKRQIFSMVNFEQTLKLDFPSHGIFLTSFAGSFDEFIELSMKVFSALQSCLPTKKGNRIAVLTSSFYKSDEQIYNELYKELFTYHVVQPFEWDNRIALRKEIEGYSEIVNSISTIRRGEVVAPFLNGGIPGDCIMFETDVNTLPQNGIARFTWDSLMSVVEALSREVRENNNRLTRYTSL